jgi:hypothetical protein
MKMTSLKQSYKDWSEPSAPSEKDEYYPSLYLDEKSLDAMGIDNPKVGTEMRMIATVRVCSASSHANGSRSMSFEILEANIAGDQDAAKILFPNG